MFQAFFFGSPDPIKDRDAQRALAVASPPPLEEGNGLLASSSTNSSSTTVVQRSSFLGLTLMKKKQQQQQQQPQLQSIADSEARTEASSDAGDSKGEVDDVGKGKEPLVDTLLNKLSGEGKGLSAVSPHRIMQAAKCLVLCCAYMAIGPTLILLNKHLLKDLDDGRGFNYPMFLSSLGLIFSTLTSHVLVRVFGWKLQNEDKMDWAFYMKVRPAPAC